MKYLSKNKKFHVNIGKVLEMGKEVQYGIIVIFYGFAMQIVYRNAKPINKTTSGT